jgi:hypothetical protein
MSVSFAGSCWAKTLRYSFLLIIAEIGFVVLSQAKNLFSARLRLFASLRVTKACQEDGPDCAGPSSAVAVKL